MTIDEAILHCYIKAGESPCAECAEEHVQLALWLEELVDLRAMYEGLCK